VKERVRRSVNPIPDPFYGVCVYYCRLAGPSTKLFAWGGGGYWGTGATRDDEPRPVRTHTSTQTNSQRTWNKSKQPELTTP
jgi:hypothetical protein